MTLATLRCVLCGTGLTMEQGIDEDGVQWTRQQCQCGRTDFLHIDRGKLDLGSIKADDDFEYEIFGPPAA